MDTSGLDDFIHDNDFSGTVLIKRGPTTVFESVAGLATQRWGVANTMDTRFDTAGRSLLLANNDRSLCELPLATGSNLRRALAAI